MIKKTSRNESRIARHKRVRKNLSGNWIFPIFVFTNYCIS